MRMTLASWCFFFHWFINVNMTFVHSICFYMCTNCTIYIGREPTYNELVFMNLYWKLKVNNEEGSMITKLIKRLYFTTHGILVFQLAKIKWLHQKIGIMLVISKVNSRQWDNFFLLLKFYPVCCKFSLNKCVFEVAAIYICTISGTNKDLKERINYWSWNWQERWKLSQQLS